MLLELARVLKDRKSPYTIELVFFDGEEATLPEWTGTDHTYGSRHYVETAKADGSLAKIRAMILFDMVADRNLNIRRETYSTRWLTDSAGPRRESSATPIRSSPTASPSRTTTSRSSMPASPRWTSSTWTTRRGTPSATTLDAISARSLQIVGDTFLDALPKIEARLATASH